MEENETCTVVNVAVLSTPGDSASMGDNRAESIPVSYFCGDLLLSKSTEEPDLERADLAHYTLVVTNRGTAELTAVQVADDLPPGFVFEPSSTTGATVVSRAAGEHRGALLFDVGAGARRRFGHRPVLGSHWSGRPARVGPQRGGSVRHSDGRPIPRGHGRSRGT